MKMLNQKFSSHHLLVDVTDAPETAPRRKTLSLARSVPAKTGPELQAAAIKRRRGRADRFALRWAEDEGMYLRAR